MTDDVHAEDLDVVRSGAAGVDRGLGAVKG